MSAGAFTQTFYEGDSAAVHIIRLQPETLSLTSGGNSNDAPTGPATSPFWVKVTKGSTEYGLGPRKVRIKWDGAPPTGYKADETLEIPVLTTAFFNSLTINAACTYLGATATIQGKIQEAIYPGI